MATIINKDFFVGDFAVVNKESAAVLEGLNYMIEKLEPQCLREIMGYGLHKAYLATPSDARMQDILNGAEYYDCNNILQKFDGLVYDTNKSLIAGYVYFYFQQKEATKTTGVNTAVLKGENAIPVSPRDKMISAWNYYSEQTRSLLSFLRYKNSLPVKVYPEIDNVQIAKSLNVSRKINFIGL